MAESEADALFLHIVEAHLAAGIPLGPAGDARLAKVLDAIAHYREKAAATSPPSQPGFAGIIRGGSLMRLFRDRPMEAVALDMLLNTALGGGAASSSGGDSAAAPLAWLCDEEETPVMMLRIVDAVWPPHSPDEVRARMNVCIMKV